MNVETTVLLTILVPILGSFAVPLFGLAAKRARSAWAVLVSGLTAVLPLTLLPFALQGGEQVIRKPLVQGFDFILVVDPLAVFMAAVSSFIGFLIVVYSLGYIRHEENQNEYYLMVLLFIGSMMGLVFSGNLIFIYLFWEIIAIACWRLIGFYREPAHVRKADKAFLLTFFGAVVMLLGFVQIYGVTNTFDITAMRGTLVPGTAVLLILFGLFSKSATVPLHTWLPDAGVAPTTVTALLHAAVLVKIGVYAFARLFIYTFRLPDGWREALPIIVMISSLVAAGAAAVETDFKRILAYSTVSQIGYIFLGFSMMNAAGVSGSVLFILMHGLAKAGLFLCAGIVIHAVHTKDIREMGGLIKTMPVTAVAFLVCSFSVIGIPPFGGFFSKFLVILGTVQGGRPWVAAMALFTAVLTMYYLFKVFSMVFLGEAKHPAPEGTKSMVYVVAALAVLSLAAGLFISYPMKLANIATTQMSWWLR
ncbi:MAG TPA: NADH-quinone oxidoreductase subunit L [Candidatus Aminicenantes bacterium]|nr:NADH-quinone oxidoreductase subunit L [Candidatus Aminicenantes bacterium]HRY64154.1 NADH-quinone oxidoreductase subunit L [Candidatus Aminicenantes bacterium]HRZ71067.1 NADH-quinone oxidoreductase subunit L [Candidatus Aminicenantes bacterium]